jgi:hypothetical protein
VMSITIRLNKLQEKVIFRFRPLYLNVVIVVVLCSTFLFFYRVVSTTAPTLHTKRVKL